MRLSDVRSVFLLFLFALFARGAPTRVKPEKGVVLESTPGALNLPAIYVHPPPEDLDDRVSDLPLRKASVEAQSISLPQDPAAFVRSFSIVFRRRSSKGTVIGW